MRPIPWLANSQLAFFNTSSAALMAISTLPGSVLFRRAPFSSNTPTRCVGVSGGVGGVGGATYGIGLPAIPKTGSVPIWFEPYLIHMQPLVIGADAGRFPARMLAPLTTRHPLKSQHVPHWP